MPHLFGWGTINPKVGGKDRTETAQSHLGGVGAGLSLGRLHLGSGHFAVGGHACRDAGTRMPAVYTALPLPRSRFASVLCDPQMETAELCVCVLCWERKKIYAPLKKERKKKSIFWRWTGTLCSIFCISEQVNLGFGILSVILIEVSDAFCFLFL